MACIGSRPAVGCFRSILVIGVLTLGAACSGELESATAPSDLSSSGAASTSALTGASQRKVDLCHRTESGFVAISVAQPAVDAHLAHGDALAGAPVPGMPGVTFGAACEISTAAPVTITFADLLVNGAPFTRLAESGFTITPTGPSTFTRDWEEATHYGNPAPFIIFGVPGGAPQTSAAILLTPDSGSFRFMSVDLYSSVTPIPYEFIGYSAQPVEGGVSFTQLFSTAGTMPGTQGRFVTVTNPYSDIPIDRLMIVLTNPPMPGCCGNAMGLDNIVVVR